jgi:hypothetical protein
VVEADGQGEGGSDGGTPMTQITGNGNGEGEVMGCDHFWWEEGEEARWHHSTGDG